MNAVRNAAGKTFRALHVRNFRLYFIGQVISVSGTWMQTIALALLVLLFLHGTGVDVGVVTALQFLPMLVLGSFGGLVVDRNEKRRILFFTQGSAAGLALVLGILSALHSVTLLDVYLVATGLGFVNMFDNPARQTFVYEMVGRELVPNAVSLNSVLMNSARVIGPAIGGVLIAAVGSDSTGFAVCFLANAASYLAVIIALVLIRRRDLLVTPPVPRAKGQVREGLRYVWTTPGLRDPLLVMAVVGVFTFNFTTTLPLLARFTFHGGAGTYSALTVAMGSGAVIGGLLVAHRSRPSAALLSLIGLAFGVMVAAVAVAPTEAVALGALVLMGVCSISFIATANATLQLRADPAMRGRVMALYAIAFLGSTPIGAPLVGWISDVSSPRVALAVGSVTTLVASAALALRYARKPVAARIAAWRDHEAAVTELPGCAEGAAAGSDLGSVIAFDDRRAPDNAGTAGDANAASRPSRHAAGGT